MLRRYAPRFAGFAVAVLAAAWFAPCAVAKRAPADVSGIAQARPALLREIEASRPPVQENGLQVQYGAESGLLRHAYRRLPGAAVAPAMPARTTVRRFLADNAPRLGLDPARLEADLELVSERQSLSGTHFRWQQRAGGVPVWRGDLVIKVANHGEVSSLHSNLRPGMDGAAKTPALDAAQALAIAERAVHPSGKPLGPFTAALWVLDLESGARLAWAASLPVESPLGDWRVWVDALTAEVLGVEDRMVYVDGSGRVFDPDPRTKMNNTTYVDNGDADSAVPFPAAYDDRTLPALTFGAGVYSLFGPYARLLDFESPVVPPVTSADPNAFFFQRSPSGFEDVHCYFHIDQNQRYIQSLGFTNVNNRVQEIDSHGLSGADNSHYVPSTKRLAFGEGGVDDAEDADVVIHEYGHSIQDNIVPGWGGGQEGAMGEGFGDYWAVSYSTSVNPTFEPSFVFNWDGHNAFWPGRVAVDSTMHYPEDCCGEVHDSGTLWCSGLIDCQRRVGRAVMDRLVLDHHFALGTSATMADAANQVIQSDIDLYGGAHIATLVNTLGWWGFVDPASFVPQIVHAPLADTENLSGPYPVVATITSAQPLDTSSLKLHWGVGAFTDSLLLAPTGNPNEYAASIPGPLANVDVRYYIVAKDVNGGRSTRPAGAPASFYTFHVGLRNAGITGRVVIAGQTHHEGVAVTSAPLGVVAFTDSAGYYALSGLYAATYTLTAAKTGYANSTRANVVVNEAAVTQYQDLVLFPYLQAESCATPNLVIPDGNVFGTANNVTVGATWAVQGVEVQVDITHPNIGDLVVEIRHGTRTVRLHNQGGGSADNIVGTYPTTLAVSGPGALADFTGDPANGTWTLRLVDPITPNAGRLNAWCIRLRGPADMSVGADPEAVPAVAALWPGAPNPAPEGRTTIRFALPATGWARLAVYDVAGRRVRDLLDGVMGAGVHAVAWDGRDGRGDRVAAGVYLYRLEAGGQRLVRKLVVVR